MIDPQPTNRAAPPRVAVLGGGITGLAAAFALHESDRVVDWRLFEASPRLGGVLRTVEQNGYRVELSADNFLTRDPHATDLAARVGLADQLLPTDPERRRAMVVCRGKVRRVPQGFVLMAPQRAWPVLASPVLSLPGKLRLMAEPFVRPRRDPADESVAAFARRRLGREAFERLVQPLIGGIYTADPERLSMRATMPQFVEQEREHGSLVRAALLGRDPKANASTHHRSESGARYGLFVAPRLGMQQLVDAVADRLPTERIACGAPTATVRPTPDGWLVGGERGESYGRFDAVIVTLPAHAAASVVAGVDQGLADSLAAIPYAGCSVVCLGVNEEQIARQVDGFGFVVPTIEGRRLIAASFASYKFPGRAPEGRVLIRAFVGGALQPELADWDDTRLVAAVREELGDLIGLRGPVELAQVARWPQRMPQYHVGHLDLVDRIEAFTARHDGLELAGAAYRGVGIPQCIDSGQRAAERVLERLALPGRL